MPNVEKVYKEYIEGINDSELKSKFTEEIKRIKESNDIKAFEEFDRKLQNVSSSDIKALEKVLGDMKGAETSYVKLYFKSLYNYFCESMKLRIII